MHESLFFKANDRIRTDNLPLTGRQLCQLSYNGVFSSRRYIHLSRVTMVCESGYRQALSFSVRCPALSHIIRERHGHIGMTGFEPATSALMAVLFPSWATSQADKPNQLTTSFATGHTLMLLDSANIHIWYQMFVLRLTSRPYLIDRNIDMVTQP